MAAIDRIIDSNCRRDWEETGKKSDNSFEQFFKLLWKPLPAMGFEFTFEEKGRETRFKVTRCPVCELARELAAKEWLYHLVCLTDEPSVTGFNPHIRFSRTQTLMQGHPICDHCYTDLSAGE